MRKTTGQKIRDERKARKFTQSELAGDFMSVDNLIQIEENQVKPSLSTLGYIAKRLDLDIDFFITEQSKIEQLAAIAKTLMVDYKEDQCEKIIDQLDVLKIQAPAIFHHDFIKEVYINTHFKHGNYLVKDGKYEAAVLCYEALLEFEADFMLDNELTAYELYTKLVDVYSMNQQHEKAQEYNKKAKELIKKMMAAKEVQNLYLLMTKGESRDVVNAARKVDYGLLDDYSKAKMNMVLGNAHFNMKHFKTAVDYLLLAIKYYEEKTYNSLTILMYEELSKCYSHLDEHELAVEYMMKAKKSQEQRHQLS